MQTFKASFSRIVVLVALFALSGCDWFVDAEQRVVRAETLATGGQDGAALIELKKAVKSEPNNVQAHVLLAEVTLRLGDVRSAEQAIEAAQASGATAEQLDRVRADIMLKKGQHADLLSRVATLKFSEAEKGAYRGHALRGLNKPDEAMAAYQDALSADPNWAPARVGLAEVFAAQGKSQDALDELEATLKHDDKNAVAWLARGAVLGRRGDFALAEESLMQAKRNAPAQLASDQYNFLLIALVESQLGGGKVEPAKQTLDELTRRTNATPLTYVLAARIAMAEQNYAFAVSESQKAIGAAPQFSQAKLLLGAALMAQGNLNQAEAHLSELVRSSPESIEARKLLAQVNLRLQRPDVAAQVLAPAQDVDLSDPQLGALLGLTSLQQGQSAAAVSWLEKSVTAQPNSSPLKLDLAMAYLKNGEAERAVELLQSMPSDARNPRRDVLLIAALASSQGSKSARAQIDRFAAEHPQDVSVLTTAAELHARFGELKRSREMLDRALAVDPKYVPAFIALTQVALANRDVTAARKAIDSAHQIDATTEVRTLRAQVALLQGDEALALAELSDVRKKDPKFTPALLMLAQIHSRAKQPAEADKIIEEAVRSTERPAAVYSAAAQMYLDSGKYEQALARFRDAIKADSANPALHLGAARAQLALANVDGAKESVENSMRVRADYAPAVAMAVMLELRGGQNDAAARRVAAFKEANPDNPTALLLEGDVFIASKKFKEAADSYGQANKIAPSPAATLREYRARTLGRLPEPAAPLVRWLDRNPDDTAVRLVLAEGLVSSGETAKAIEQYELMARSPQPNAAALNNLAWLYHEAGDARAIATAERAYALAPNVAAIADTLGWILVQTGDKNRGLAILREAASAGASAEIRFHYAQALAATGDQPAARRELELLVREAPNSAVATKAKELLAREGG
jgi:putative PEP-CTERM system TPR-repeat lipoprotein